MNKKILGLSGRALALLAVLAGLYVMPGEAHDRLMGMVMGGTTLLTLVLLGITVIQIASTYGRRDSPVHAAPPQRSERSTPAQFTAAATEIGPTARMRRSVESDTHATRR